MFQWEVNLTIISNVFSYIASIWFCEDIPLNQVIIIIVIISVHGRGHGDQPNIHRLTQHSQISMTAKLNSCQRENKNEQNNKTLNI